jgi:hypothetical protein
LLTPHAIRIEKLKRGFEDRERGAYTAAGGGTEKRERETEERTRGRRETAVARCWRNG